MPFGGKGKSAQVSGPAINNNGGNRSRPAQAIESALRRAAKQDPTAMMTGDVSLGGRGQKRSRFDGEKAGGQPSRDFAIGGREGAVYRRGGDEKKRRLISKQ